MIAKISAAIAAVIDWLKGTYLSVGQVIGIILVLSAVVLIVDCVVKDEPMWVIRRHGKQYIIYARSGLKEVQE